MAFDILSSLLKAPSFSMTDQSGIPFVMRGIAVTKVNIKLSSKCFRNQKEDGSYNVDGRILLPGKLNVTIVCQDQSAAERIVELFQNTSVLYTIKTRGLIFNNLVLANNAFDQNPDNISSQPIQLVFNEIITESQAVPVTLQAADSNMIDSGIAYLKNTANTAIDLGNKVIGDIQKSISGLF